MRIIEMDKPLGTPKHSFKGFAGISAMLLSVIALVAVVVQLAAGPFAPQPPVEENIVDLLDGVKDAVERRATGQAAAAPEYKAWDADRILITASICVAGLAMLFGALALALKEPRTPALIGFGLGAGTLFVVWLQWIALVIVATLLIVAIIGLIGGEVSF